MSTSEAGRRTPIAIEEEKILLLNVYRDEVLIGFVNLIEDYRCRNGTLVLNKYRRPNRLEEVVDVTGIAGRFGGDVALGLAIWRRGQMDEEIRTRDLVVQNGEIHRGELERFERLLDVFMAPADAIRPRARHDRIDIETDPVMANRSLREMGAPGRMTYPRCSTLQDFWMPAIGDIEEYNAEVRPLYDLLVEKMAGSGLGSAHRDAAMAACAYGGMLCPDQDSLRAMIDMSEDLARRFWTSTSRAGPQKAKEAAKEAIKAGGSWVPTDAPNRPDVLQTAYMEIRERTRFHFTDALAPIMFEIENDMMITFAKLHPMSPRLTMLNSVFLGDDDMDGRPGTRKPMLLPAA